MKAKIVYDSCCDLDLEMTKDIENIKVPLSITIGETTYIDESIDTHELLKAMKACKESPKTACPAPGDYYKAFEGEAQDVYVVTLSSELSGSYNSALVAKGTYMEDHPTGKNIHVFDSRAASVAETLIYLKVKEMIKENCSFEKIVEKTSAYIADTKTLFMLDSLQNLAKAGRLNTITAKITDVLNIKLVCGATSEGTIEMIDKARGENNALNKLVDAIGKEGKQLEGRILAISHCNCMEKALRLKEKIMAKYNFKEIIVVETGGLSTTYTDQGGLILAF